MWEISVTRINYSPLSSTPIIWCPPSFQENRHDHKKIWRFHQIPSHYSVGGGGGWCHEAFWFISQGPDFSHIWKFFRNIANNMSFLFRPIWKKPTNQHRAEEWKERWMDRPYIIGIRQLLQGFKKIFKTNLGLKGPIIFGRIGTNMVKQEFFWIKKTIFCIWCAYGPH